MTFEFSSLEPQIRQILSAPGTDLTTISAKRVRRALLELDSTLTPEFLKENKEDVDRIIGIVFEEIQEQATGESEEVREESENAVHESRKRKQEEEMQVQGQKQEEKDELPPTKKAKKVAKTGNELSGDAELARQLSSEINARSTRGAGKSRAGANGTAKKGARQKKKSAATVDSDDGESEEEGGKKTKKPRKKPAGEKKEGGTAKGGFAKEYVLSAPLSALLEVDKLSRPQVVKRLWDYIKGNELQNPSNRREILCDERFRAVFSVDKLNMFKMNQVLGQHLHETEG